MQRAVLSLHATARWHAVLPCCHAQHHTQHCTSRSAKLIKKPSSLITKVEKSWQDFLLSEGGGEAICTVSAFCCHVDPENTTFCLRALWTWWLKHVMERGREQDPGLHGEPAD